MARNLESINEALPTPSTPLKRRTWLFMAVTIIALGVGIFYLIQASNDAMKGVPDSNRPVEEIYAARCGACHPAPPAQDFAKWERDWERMARITMFMPGEQEATHHYLDRLSRGQQALSPS